LGIAAIPLEPRRVDFGMIVAALVVMIENCVLHIAHGYNQQRLMIDVVRDAAVEVRRPHDFRRLIIMIVLPAILTLEGSRAHSSGRCNSPLICGLSARCSCLYLDCLCWPS